MSIASRIEAIEEHLTDDYSVLTLAGADLTGVNKNIVNLKMSWKERLLYFMNNGTDDVWNNWTKVSGTGTTLSLNNTEEAPMSLTYKGNTSQNGTPTPTFPIPVQVVSGDNSIEVKGKNLCDLGTISDYIPASRVRSIDDNVMSIRVFDAGETYAYKTNQNYEGNMTYTFSSIASSPSSRFYIRLRKLDDSAWMTNADVSISGWTYNAYYKGWFRYFTDTNISITTTIPNCLYWQIGFGYNSTGEMVGTTQTISNIQIEKGNQATTYEEYKGASYPISLGNKELCKIGTYQDKIDKSSGKNLVQMSLYNANNYVSQKLTLEAGNYYFAYTGDNASAIYIRKADGSTPINGTSVKERYNGTTIYFTTNETGEYYIQCYLGGGGFTKFTEAMLNEGTDYLPYEPYGTNWYLKKEIGKVVLNGSEVKWYTFGGANYEYQSIISEGYSGSDYKPSISNRYVNNNVTGANLQNYQYSCFIQSGEMYVRFRHNDITTLADYKTWLGTNNVIVYYPLATPTYETITDTTLIGQLEALKKSYESQTNISQVNNDLPFELSVTALEVMS